MFSANAASAPWTLFVSASLLRRAIFKSEMEMVRAPRCRANISMSPVKLREKLTADAWIAAMLC